MPGRVEERAGELQRFTELGDPMPSQVGDDAIGESGGTDALNERRWTQCPAS